MGKAPDKCITPQQAQTLFDQWETTRGADLKKDLGYTDTCEFNLNIAELREYLDYIEEESNLEGIENPGVRVYFGAYNNTKSNKATIFLAPTLNDGIDADNNYKISPMNFNQGGIPPKKYNP